MDQTSTRMEWTDRGFCWERQARYTWLPPTVRMLSWLLLPLSFLLLFLFLVGVIFVALAEPGLMEGVFVAGVVLGVVLLVGWPLRWLNRAMGQVTPGLRIEVVGPKVLLQTVDMETSFDLEHLVVTEGRAGVLEFEQEGVTRGVEPGEDAAWLSSEIRRAQDAWRTNRAGAMPEAEAAALARLTQRS